jgi:ABC-2 type transport system ATP-binding protein
MLIIEAEGLDKRYDGVRALDRVSFTVGRGEVFALVGPNGAGKTTLLRMLTGILRQDAGTLKLFGSADPVEARPHVGYMPEERGLYKGLTPLETVAYFGQLRGLSWAEARKAAEGALEAVGMLGHGKRKIEELSKGMAQRVQFAATIVHRPRLLVLDEPFTGLDPVSALHMRQVVSQLRSDGGTILLSTHNMDHAEKLCDRLLMLHRGRVRLYGQMETIKNEHTSAALHVEFAGELPPVDGATVERLDANRARITPHDGLGRREVLAALVGSGADIVRFEPVAPTLEEIFIRVVGEEGERDLQQTRQAAMASEG